MDTDARPEIDLTSAFEKIGQVSFMNSVADFTDWIKEKRASRTRENRRRKRTANAKGIIFIFHEDEEPPFVAPKAARMPQANQNQLECLYGPQQIITNVFFKRSIGQQEQFLVRWTPTFMLSPHILAYCKMGYKAESIRPLKGAFNQSCPTLRLVSWVDSWEPGTTIRAIRHLDGDVLRIDEEAGTQAAKIPWAKAKDMHLHNLDRQTFQGSAACNINNPFNLEPFLHNFVRIKTGETINPDLDVAPTGMYGILADPRPLTEGQEALSIVF